jgi:hypothetical protein
MLGSDEVSYRYTTSSKIKISVRFTYFLISPKRSSPPTGEIVVYHKEVAVVRASDAYKMFISDSRISNDVRNSNNCRMGRNLLINSAKN